MMTYQEKLDWLEKIFNNDPRIRAKAMSTEIPQPLFESQEDFAKALEELVEVQPPEMQCVNCWHRWKPEQHFRDTPKCPECGSTWLITAETLKMGLRKEHEHKLPW